MHATRTLAEGFGQMFSSTRLYLTIQPNFGNIRYFLSSLFALELDQDLCGAATKRNIGLSTYIHIMYFSLWL